MNRSSLGRTLIGAALTVLLSTVALTPASAASAPVVSWQTTIIEGGSYLYGQVPSAACTATVDLAPVPCVVDGYADTVGVHTLTALVDGMPATPTISYTVTAWTLKGFGKPVRMTSVNKVKAGSTVPFKFKVYEGATKVKSAGVVASFTAQRYDCSTLAAIGTASPVTSTKKGFTLKYRDGAFHQNWKTPKLAKAAKVKGKKPAAASVCYAVTLTTKDASTLTASFLLK
jgi:hypothetical protein